ncbi:MAG: DMT family transporter [Coriobacteriales bacterium]|jgi:drug/metabolite transporter (DMT)-like permease|nr:DMT family transporter [Coriobacteriales bacterium]
MPQTLKHSLIIFAAGVVYGLMIPLARAAFTGGFTVAQIAVAQYLAAALLMGVVVVIASRRRIPLRTVAQLLGVGVLASGVSIFYYRALELLPSATAVTLLFQFVWMGVVVQALREHALPRIWTLLSVVVIMTGTIFATGLVETGLAALALNPLGIVFGLLSAAFYTAFLVASAQVATNLPATNRSFINSIGSLLVAALLCPSFFASDTIINIGWIGLALGLAVVIPVFLIAHSAPHLPSGLVTIMAASELPSGILCAALFAGDIISPSTVVGVVIVVLGIALSESDTLFALLKQKKASS